MSSYLNLYLLPKKKEGDTVEPKPLLLYSWSRNTNIYSTFYEELNPVFIGNGEEPLYTEVSAQDLNEVVNTLSDDATEYENRIENTFEAYQKIPNLSKDIISEYIEDYTSSKEYINELRETCSFMRFLHDLLSDLKYSDFEKILINID